MLRDLFSLFPAYAGVIPKRASAEKATETFPRIRGGDPFFVLCLSLCIYFSPHTRG